MWPAGGVRGPSGRPWPAGEADPRGPVSGELEMKMARRFVLLLVAIGVYAVSYGAIYLWLGREQESPEEQLLAVDAAAAEGPEPSNPVPLPREPETSVEELPVELVATEPPKREGLQPEAAVEVPPGEIPTNVRLDG